MHHQKSFHSNKSFDKIVCTTMKDLEAHDEKVGGDATFEDTTSPLEKPSPLLGPTYNSQVFQNLQR
jgi:hypothetical protein